MVTQRQIVEQGHKLGFEDVGFTSADPFRDHENLLIQLADEYDWADKVGLDLKNGVDPCSILPTAKTIIVLIEPYFNKSYPAAMEAHFGRCYLDDDRVTKDGLAKRIKAFRQFLRDEGIESRVPFNLPHRVAAARAGLGTFGKNCLFYSNKAVGCGSWTLPIAVVIDKHFSPGTPSIKTDCPSWCKNACIAACPTHALKGNSRIDPRKCISYLTYFGDKITPLALREPMGMYIYGCDRCQNVCPRNQPWLARQLPVNERVAAKAKDFDLPLLLHMDNAYFETKIWPHMFYMGSDTIWKWKMNVARVMGNSRDDAYLPDLERAFTENTDARVKGMAAWAMGRIGSTDTRSLLKKFAKNNTGTVFKEIELAIQSLKNKTPEHGTDK
ncbi:MAG: epoxyqueuosine reductase [Proteobacteria bacterium]|nr:epoxyqueuosine reductase [Pseudomonadota bacterium]